VIIYLGTQNLIQYKRKWKNIYENNGILSLNAVGGRPTERIPFVVTEVVKPDIF
jgi:hypothetical protein